MSSFVEILRDFAESTTAHGVGRVSSSKSVWLRLFWLLAFLASLSVFIWQSTNLIKYYYSRPVAVDSRTTYGFVDFPAVTFCNLNPLRNSMLNLGGDELRETLQELENNINDELSGSTTMLAKRKKRAPEDSSGCSHRLEPYQMYSGDNTLDMESAGYGFGSSKLEEPRHRVRRGGGSSISSISSSFEIPHEPSLPPERSIASFTEETTEDTLQPTTESMTTLLDHTNENSTLGFSSTEHTTFQGEFSSIPHSSESSGSLSSDQSDSAPSSWHSSTANSIDTSSFTSFSSSSHEEEVIILEDPADEYYNPVVDISDKPWFANNSGSTAAEVKNTRRLSEALSETPLSTRRAMGYRIDGMLQECTWNGRICTPLNFTSFYSKKYGNCFTFNSGYKQDIQKVEKSGALYGLTMLLFINQSDYIESFASGVGVRLLIHRQDEQPFPEENGFSVIPGLKTSVSLSVRHYDKLPEPYSNCTYGTTNETLMFNKNYSTLACLKSCSQDRKLSKCQCADPLLSLSDDFEICSDTATECLEEVDLAINRGEILCNCPILCRENLYVSSISTSTWPGEKFLTTVQQLFSNRGDGLREAVSTASSISENFIKVEAFFDEVKHVEITESRAYDIGQLLADIGGQLGLWIGVSVLTGAEVIQLFIEIIVFIVRRKRGSAKVAQPPTPPHDITYVAHLPKVDS